MSKHDHLVEELRDDLHMGILPLVERLLHVLYPLGNFFALHLLVNTLLLDRLKLTLDVVFDILADLVPFSHILCNRVNLLSHIVRNLALKISSLTPRKQKVSEALFCFRINTSPFN